MRWFVKVNENNSINHSEGMSSFFCYFFLFSLLLDLLLFSSEEGFSLFFKEVYASIEGYGVLSDLPNLRLSDWIFY